VTRGIRRELARAMACHRSGRLAEAERRYGELIERAPDNAEVWRLLGRLAQQRGEGMAAAARVADRAALISQLNLVILADGMPAHLAGPQWTLPALRLTGAGFRTGRIRPGIRPCGSSGSSAAAIGEWRRKSAAPPRRSDSSSAGTRR
jgi:hypothetical protein